MLASRWGRPGVRMARLLQGLAAMGSPLASTVADPYRVLGLTAAASGAEIKAAYRALVKQHHPDAGGDEERIIALNAAWELLRDGERRRAGPPARHRARARHQDALPQGAR